MLSGPVAYLTGQYPRATDTFIKREVDHLRAHGVPVETHTIRRTGPEHMVSDAVREEQARTFAVLEAAKRPGTLAGAHAGLLARRPGAWMRALRLAWRTRPPGTKNALWQGFYFLEAGVLAARLRAIGARQIHNHFGDSSCTVAMLAAEMAGVPLSFTLHGPAEFYAPDHWRLDEKVARAAMVACIGHFARSQAMLFSDEAHWDRIRIVHCGVEPDALPPLGPVSVRDGGAGPRLLFVGRLAAVKGAPLLLDAMAALARRHADARLTFVGDGPDRAALERRVDAAGLRDRVTFTGYLDPAGVAARLREADALVLPSFAEGVPVVLMEAMATAIPVVTTRIAGIPELVEDGVSGLVVPPGDVAALTGALERLAADHDLGVRLGRAGRETVVAGYDVRVEAAWLRRLLDGAAAGALPDGLRPGASEGDAAA